MKRLSSHTESDKEGPLRLDGGKRTVGKMAQAPLNSFMNASQRAYHLLNHLEGASNQTCKKSINRLLFGELDAVLKKKMALKTKQKCCTEKGGDGRPRVPHIPFTDILAEQDRYPRYPPELHIERMKRLQKLGIGLQQQAPPFWFRGELRADGVFVPQYGIGPSTIIIPGTVVMLEEGVWRQRKLDAATVARLRALNLSSAGDGSEEYPALPPGTQPTHGFAATAVALLDKDGKVRGFRPDDFNFNGAAETAKVVGGAAAAAEQWQANAFGTNFNALGATGDPRLAGYTDSAFGPDGEHMPGAIWKGNLSGPIDVQGIDSRSGFGAAGVPSTSGLFGYGPTGIASAGGLFGYGPTGVPSTAGLPGFGAAGVTNVGGPFGFGATGGPATMWQSNTKSPMPKSRLDGIFGSPEEAFAHLSARDPLSPSVKTVMEPLVTRTKLVPTDFGRGKALVAPVYSVNPLYPAAGSATGDGFVEVNKMEEPDRTPRMSVEQREMDQVIEDLGKLYARANNPKAFNAHQEEMLTNKEYEDDDGLRLSELINILRKTPGVKFERILYHEPFDPSKPLTWMRWFPKSIPKEFIKRLSRKAQDDLERWRVIERTMVAKAAQKAMRRSGSKHRHPSLKQQRGKHK